MLPALVSIADVIMLLYREELHDYETDKKGIMEVSVAKNRSTGMVGVLPLQFDATTTYCVDLTFRTPPDAEQEWVSSRDGMMAAVASITTSGDTRSCGIVRDSDGAGAHCHRANNHSQNDRH